MSVEERNNNQQQVELTTCIKPSEIDQSNINAVERMLASHTWKVNKISHEQAKIKIKYSCVRCKTERFAFVEWIPKT